MTLHGRRLLIDRVTSGRPVAHATILDLHASTVHRVLTRHHMPKLAWLDRPTVPAMRAGPRRRFRRRSRICCSVALGEPAG